MKAPYLALISVAAMAHAGYGLAQSADNSKSNAAPVNSSQSSSIADGQKNDARDLRLTQAIRKSVLADKSLSIDARNVKIVAVNGYVTLNGVVRSDAEKSSVEAKAMHVAGVDKVKDHLQVAPPS